MSTNLIEVTYSRNRNNRASSFSRLVQLPGKQHLVHLQGKRSERRRTVKRIGPGRGPRHLRSEQGPKTTQKKPKGTIEITQPMRARSECKNQKGKALHKAMRTRSERRRKFLRFYSAERPGDGRENGDLRARSAEENC